MQRKMLVALLTLLVLAQGLVPIALAAGERAARVNAESLNLRDGPGTTYAVLRSLARDTIVTIVGEQGDWLQVRLADGTAGWVASQYVAPMTVEPGDASGAGQRPTGAGEGKATVGAQPARSEARGGSTLGAIVKWGCLVGAVAAGGLGYVAHSNGNDAYDEYQQLYRQGDFDRAEGKYQDAIDKDDQAQVCFIAAGVLVGLWALQQFVLGGGGGEGESAALVPAKAPVTWEPRTENVRAALVRVRF